MSGQPVHASPIIKNIGLSLVVIAGLGAIAGIWLLLPSLIPNRPDPNTSRTLDSFKDGAAYTKYLQDSQSQFANGAIGLFGRAVEDMVPTIGTKTDSGTATPRTIGTNVQVKGLDEPDIVKTDGHGIFVSRQSFTIYDLRGDVAVPPSPAPIPVDGGQTEPSTGSGSSPATKEDPGTATSVIPADILPPDKIVPPAQVATTTVIDASQVAVLKKSGAIPDAGQLMLAGKKLIVLSGTTVIAYDIANLADPKKLWTMPLADGTTVVTGRGSDDSLLLVTQQYTQPDRPCPLTISKSSVPVDLPCGNLYHPIEIGPASVVLAVLNINPVSGAIVNRVGFTGTDGISTVYVSPTAVYLTYPIAKDQASVDRDFYGSLGSVLPSALRARLQTLDGYDISPSARSVEFQRALGEYIGTLSAADQTVFQKKMTDARAAYDLEHQRDLLKTGIVKIDPTAGEIKATGSVPGTLLNQYSLDENDNLLRLATTVGPNWWGSTPSTANDVYILDADLRQVGSLTGLGRDERIYAARFVRDRAYLVTFKQIDPFFVIDLSNPRVPVQAGELKLPGYSSYLHPLTPTLILGIGQDGAAAKATLFDVSDAASPKEVSTLTLPGGWSEVNGDPHAFLHDPDQAAVFIPAGSEGVVLTYTAAGLKQVARVGELAARRAVVIGDRMVIIGDTAIKTVRESDWTIDQTLTYN